MTRSLAAPHDPTTSMAAGVKQTFDPPQDRCRNRQKVQPKAVIPPAAMPALRKPSRMKPATGNAAAIRGGNYEAPAQDR